ncbi:PREDICTED: cation channel sperm-associated protein 1 [Propithecus coquereli]|uniref:cation channel sperm-associated protein 1 n=1 Tax=Propithecus coquereli TaxID=379532 RepID=UPI00063F916F|nr:PREDICTED: cation channel sperm-associated protein 1 [Propithecus coquereli]
MDQTSMSEKAQNEADTNNLDMSSRPHSSFPHHRPGLSGADHHRESPHDRVAHHHSESPHHGTPHHHNGSHHSREFQDLHNNASSYHSSQSHHHSEALHHGRAHSPTASGPAASHGIVSSHHAIGEDHFNDEHHHGSRMHHSESHHGGSHHHAGSHHGGSHHHGRSRHHGGPHYHGGPKPLDENLSQHSYSGSSHHDGHYPHSETSHHAGLHRGWSRHHEAHHQNRLLHHGETISHLSSEGSYDHGIPRYHSEHDYSDPHSSKHHLGEHPLSSKVHPKDSSSKDSESWDTEDEQFQKRKTGRSQRAHKKMHTWSFFHWLWDKLSYFIEEFRSMIWNLTHSLVFEVFIFFVICLNTIMLVVQTFAEVEIRGEWYFMALDSIFFCIYVLEALLKIIALGFSYFRDMWNNLDFFIMIIAMLDFVLMQLDAFSIYQLSLFRILKVFKSLRALRVIRVLRKLSVLTSLHEVTGTLARSLPSITAILILMFTCLFLFSVVLRALFRKSDPKRFQSIFSTIFTLFTLLTLDDWSLIYMDSRAQGAWYIIPILMIYIIIQYFIFLNLVIAVLVDNFQMALLKGLEKVKQERAAQVQEKLLEDSLTELKQAEPEEELSEGTRQKQFLEKKFGAMTEKQQQLLFHYLQLVAGVETQQQKFRSQAFIIDEIVDVTFEAGEEDFRR